VAENPEFERGMFSSVQAGIRSLPASAGPILVLPADIPLVKSRTVASLIKAHRGGGRAVAPSFLGKTGHPVLLPRELVSDLLAYGGDGGLREFLRRSGGVAPLPVADQGVLLDMDHPEDYRALLAYAERRKVPNRAECLALLALMGTPEPVVRHTRAVAAVALRIGRALAEEVSLDLPLLEAAALLHDLAKGRKRHETVAARALHRWGYAPVASVVGAHTDLPRKASPEQRILYLADKMVNGERLEGLEGRLVRMEARFAGNPEALKGARRRIGRARKIRTRLEVVLGRSLDEVIGPWP
jgi:HD superfamily phosphohydrolase YqeK